MISLISFINEVNIKLLFSDGRINYSYRILKVKLSGFSKTYSNNLIVWKRIAFVFEVNKFSKSLLIDYYIFICAG